MRTQTITSTNKDIIVFSHLRWEFVKQRPQHIIERFAKTYRVLFVEEPIGATNEHTLKAREIQVSKNLLVIQPHLDSLEPKALSSIVSRYMNQLRMTKPMLWFYSASFVDITEYIPHETVVYDCMDELTAFVGAPPELLEKEAELLRQADVVFTGGYSLYEAKKNRHDRVFSFPSSVDREHFAQAYKKKTIIPDELMRLPKPIAGFYGVLDERLDLSLISYLAKTLPTISFVYIGPVVKINPDSLPKRPNIHYLGQQLYDKLPSFLKGFDMAIMPFARNEATKFISPTKTLEFMSALKPIISTPIHDVIHDFSSEVTIPRTKEDFVQAIKFYKEEPLFHKLQRQLVQRTAVTRNSWDKTVATMQQIIQSVEQGTQKNQLEHINYGLTSATAPSYI